MFDPIAGQWIDNGQHLTLGCCKEFLALNRRLGLEGCFSRYDSIPFVQHDGRRWDLAANSFLPPSWQFAPAFMRIPFLPFGERLKTAYLLRKLDCLARNRLKGNANDGTTAPSGSSSTEQMSERTDFHFGEWLISQHVSRKAIECFWEPLIYSALSETPELASFQAVLKVVRDGLFLGGQAMSVYLPTQPLRSLYHDRLVQELERLGGRLHLLNRVVRLHWDYRIDTENSGQDAASIPRIESLELADGSTRQFDAYILAVPVYRTRDILDASDLSEFAEQLELGRFEPGAITTVHLWLNRPLLPKNKPFAALLGGPGQFLVCHRERRQDESSLAFPVDSRGVYHTVVISASHRLLPDEELTSHGSLQLIGRVVEQLQSSFSKVKFERRKTADRPSQPDASIELRHARVTTFFDAVFSPSPKVYCNRPSQETPFSNLAFAGDWTQTDWPSTLEGAVLSGQKAVATIND